MKRISGKLLIAVVLTALLGICAWAAETAEPKVVPQPEFQIEVFHANPEYEALGVRFAKPDADCMTTAETTAANLAAAADYLREQMEDRVTEVVIRVTNYPLYASEGEYDKWITELVNNWLAVLTGAFEHTGVPTQGDYLARHYGGAVEGSTASHDGKSTAIFKYIIVYDTTPEQENAVGDKIDALFAQWDKKHDFYDLSDYEKVEIIYDYICDTVTYDYDTVYDDEYTLKYSAYAALIKGTAVCQGYANLFYRMVLEAGIDNRIIVGFGGGGYHSWNIVELRDKYYYLDATWDAGQQDYQYFLLGSVNFCKNHTPDSTYDWDCRVKDYAIDTEDYDVAPQLTASNRADSGKIVLSWTALKGADGYELYRSDAVDGEYICIYSGTGTEVVDRSSTIGRTYYYKVRAWDGDSYSEFSKTVVRTGNPAQPVVTCAVNEDTGNPVLTWTEVSGAEEYEVWRADSANGKYTLLWTGTGRTLTNSSVEKGRTYYYKVRAVAGSVSSAYSAVVSATVPVQLDVPKVTVRSLDSGEPRLSWGAVDDAAKYEIWRSTSESGTYSRIYTTKYINYTDSTAVSGVTYYYKVRAVAGDFCGEFSPVVSITVSVKLVAPDLTVSNNAGTGKVVLSWSKVDGAEKYEIWYSSSKSGAYTKLWTGSGTQVTHSSIAAGTTCYYKVRAVTGETCSKFSDIEFRTCDLPRPVVTLSNKTATGKIIVSWTAVAGASKYEVYRATSEDGTYTRLITTTGTQIINSSTEPGVTYYYKVKAIHGANSSANSAYSAVKSRTCDLAQPEITLSNNESTGKIVVSWTAVIGASKYEVYRATNKNDTYTLLKTTTGTKFTDTSTEPGVTYYYKVRAICGTTSSGNSAYSAVKSRTCDLARPVATVTNNSTTGKIVLTWKAVAGADKYEVYRSTSEDGTYTKVLTTTGLKMNHNSANAGETYYYKVKAICTANSSGNSAFSTVKARTCDCASPSVTITLNSKGRPVLSWKAVDGAVEYEVYRSTSENGKYTLLWTGSGTKLTNSSAEEGMTYYYKVRAICSVSAGNSAYSAIHSVTVG